MENSAFDELPRAYRIGLRLRALGADDELIGDCLDIDPDGIVTLLEIGAHKLEHLQQAPALSALADEVTAPGDGSRVKGRVSGSEGQT
jgi:hypothetical protein